jgi:hypothetical protein
VIESTSLLQIMRHKQNLSDNQLAHRDMTSPVIIPYDGLSVFDRIWILQASRDTETKLDLNINYGADTLCLRLISIIGACMSELLSHLSQ